MIKAILKYLLHTCLMMIMLIFMAVMYFFVAACLFIVALLTPFFSWKYEFKNEGMSFKFQKQDK